MYIASGDNLRLHFPVESGLKSRSSSHFRLFLPTALDAFGQRRIYLGEVGFFAEKVIRRLLQFPRGTYEIAFVSFHKDFFAGRFRSF